MIGTFWKSHLSHTFEVLRIWTDRRPEWDKPIRWVEVRQHGGAFDGEVFKWCLDSLFLGGMKRVEGGQ